MLNDMFSWKFFSGGKIAFYLEISKIFVMFIGIHFHRPVTLDHLFTLD